MVGKLKLFPDSEWKHCVVAATVVVAGVSSFSVTAVHHCLLRNTIALSERIIDTYKFEARSSLYEQTDSLSLSVNASLPSPAICKSWHRQDISISRICCLFSLQFKLDT